MFFFSCEEAGWCVCGCVFQRLCGRRETFAKLVIEMDLSPIYLKALSSLFSFSICSRLLGLQRPPLEYKINDNDGQHHHRNPNGHGA